GGAKAASDESGKAAASDEQSPSVAPPKKPRVPKKPVVAANENMSRRGGLVMLTSVVTWASVGWTSFSAACAVMLGGLTRFMFPNWLREPPSQFKIGAPGEYAPESVSTKWAAQYGIWVVNTVYEGQSQIYALKTVCTHLGCTPNWLDAEQKFKCPCHGSGFRISGINFEGPAPRPLERYAIQLADDGLLEVDKSQTFQQEMGQWENASSFVAV
ncbi:MAG: ubiquinol-cytochrome c reductase iron-sulfur subunit, partial [Planctomycetota bacterium]|nr:ubiquinol-cytochrome c reductase iron-sulfur subunit [Planctomycetota bacterium]